MYTPHVVRSSDPTRHCICIRASPSRSVLVEFVGSSNSWLYTCPNRIPNKKVRWDIHTVLYKIMDRPRDDYIMDKIDYQISCGKSNSVRARRSQATGRHNNLFWRLALSAQRRVLIQLYITVPCTSPARTYLDQVSKKN